jgi:hypothetical protein
MQCTSISLVALLLLFQGGGVDFFRLTSIDIDRTLSDGIRLYAQIVGTLNELRYLSHNDLQNTVLLQNEQFYIGYTKIHHLCPFNSNILKL